ISGQSAVSSRRGAGASATSGLKPTARGSAAGRRSTRSRRSYGSRFNILREHRCNEERKTRNAKRFSFYVFRFMSTLVITGGAGFIGSNLVHYALAETADRLVIVDKLTYAGSLLNLEGAIDNPRVVFVQADIAD